MILLICTFVILITLVLAYLRQYYSLSPTDPPGMKPQIFYGNLINSGLCTGQTTIHEILIAYQKRYGDIFQFWLGSYQCFFFCQLEHAATVFKERHIFEQSSLVFPNFDLLCSNNMITLIGTKWKRHKQLLLPYLKRRKLANQIDSMVFCADRFIDSSLQDHEIHRDLIASCQSFTMNVMGFIILGRHFDICSNSPIQLALKDFVLFAELISMTLWVPRWCWKIYLRFNWKYQHAYRLIRSFAQQVIREAQNESLDQRQQSLLSSIIGSVREQGDVKEISSDLTHAELLDEMITMILAGYQTTSAALAWFIFFASKNPSVQNKIKDELREYNLLIRKDLQRIPELNEANLSSLSYCECVVKEVLRLAPINDIAARTATQDTFLDHIKIRRGQTICIPLHNINTDDRYWHHIDPQQFIPDRFLGEDRDHHPLAMIPFGGGHRACIGQDLTYLELKVMIVRLMQRGVTFMDTPENTGGCNDSIPCAPRNLVVHVRFDSL